MKKRLFVGLAALALAFAATAAHAQTIKLGTLAPKGSPWWDILQDMGAAWTEAADGAIRVRIYPGGSIGDETDMVRKMLIGQLQGAVLTSEGLGRIAPELRVLQLPMVYRSDAELDYVHSKLKPDLEALFERRGYKLLNWGDIGWIRLFTKEPAPSPVDLEPMKLFCWTGDSTICDAWREQGFTPVPLAMTDIFSGLQSGMIDAVFSAPVPALTYQWFGLAQHMTDIKLTKMFGATIMTMKAWEKIPEAARAGVLKAAEVAGRRSEEKIRSFEVEAIEVMRRNGLTVHPMSPEQNQAWEKRMSAAIPILLDGIVPEELIAKAERLREEFRARAAAK